MSYLPQVQLGKILDATPLIQKLLLAIVAAASVFVFALTVTEAFSVWVNRSFAIKQRTVASKNSHRNRWLSDKVRKVGKGSDVVITVKADNNNAACAIL